MRALSIVAGIAAATLVLAACTSSAPPPVTRQPPPTATHSPRPAAEPSVQFTASGDIGVSEQSAAVLGQIASIRPDLHLALGDLSYGRIGAEQAWCDFVTAKTGVGFPFELLSGNHESAGRNGNINDFAACLPNQLPGLVGTYGREYYVDVPQVNPLVRFVMISPGLSYPNGPWVYTEGSKNYRWTAEAIDGARSARIPWVVVGMHKPCLSVGRYDCDAGADVLNLLVAKGVDLVLSGHEHLYARSKQLALGPSCEAIAPGSYSEGCAADAGNGLVQGAGTVFMIAGTGGRALRDVNASDPEAGYFAAYSGLNREPSHGNADIEVTAGELTARFVPVAGGTFTDAFTITAG